MGFKHQFYTNFTPATRMLPKGMDKVFFHDYSLRPMQTELRRKSAQKNSQTCKKATKVSLHKEFVYQIHIIICANTISYKQTITPK